MALIALTVGAFGCSSSDDTSPPSVATIAPASTSAFTTDVTVTSQPEGATGATPDDVRSLPVPVSSTSFRVRDCFDLDDRNRANPVRCDQLHDGQITQIDVALPGVSDSEQDPAVWLFASTATCGPSFELFVGGPLGHQGFIVGTVVVSGPDAPVIIACSAVTVNGTRWAGTAEHLVGVYEGIGVGDCFDYPTERRGAVEVPCETAHEGEMFLVDSGVGLDSLTDAYPTPDVWEQIAAFICTAPFSEYTGISDLEASTLTYAYVYVVETDWGELDLRRLSCAVVNADGTRLTGPSRR